jgi:hypothetical protein
MSANSRTPTQLNRNDRNRHTQVSFLRTDVLLIGAKYRRAVTRLSIDDGSYDCLAWLLAELGWPV